MAPSCDLNADLGESYGAWRMGDDGALLSVVSSCNLACGFHAGDPLTIQRTIDLALQHRVAIGAHPSLPDLQGFGRREMQIGSDELYAMTLYQVAALQGMVSAAGGLLHHVKPHGALYAMVERDHLLASAFVRAVRALGADLLIYGPPQGALRDRSNALEQPYVGEGFADRGYMSTGSLVSRRAPGAHLALDAALSQGLALAEGRPIRTQEGGQLTADVRTLCVHGDGPDAVALARRLRECMESAGIRIAAP